jgi:hypothetical protein
MTILKYICKNGTNILRTEKAFLYKFAIILRKYEFIKWKFLKAGPKYELITNIACNFIN